MPDGIEGCGAFHNERAADYRAKVGDLIQHSIQLSDLVLGGFSLIFHNVIAIISESHWTFSYPMPSTNNGANFTSLANVYSKL